MSLQTTELRKSIIIGFTAYLITVFLITLHNNSYRMLDFCGSYSDFHSETTPTVCLTLPEYFLKAIVHPEFVLPASIVALIISLAYYGKFWRIVDSFRD